MVAHVLRLRLDLLIGALRGDRRRVTRHAIALVLLIVAVGVVNSKRAQRHGSLGRVWVGATGEGIAA